jgi:hypothetical protein
VPSNPTSYRVRIKDPSGNQIPTGSGYNLFDSSGNFTFAPLAVGTYTYAVRIPNGSWPSNYLSGPTILLGVSTPYVKVHTVN